MELKMRRRMVFLAFEVPDVATLRAAIAEGIGNTPYFGTAAT
jgi:hypothetical protein